MRSTESLVALAGAAVLATPLPAHAVLPDEIQVYIDDLRAPGERGVEVHVNTTPKGHSAPEYPGAVPTQHGLRITPEISFGLSKDTDWGIYIPGVRSAEGDWYLPGLKLRAKWIPIRGDEPTGGMYLGVNGEISNISHKFSASRVSSELRLIAGYRSADWLIGVNPIFTWELSPGQGQDNPGFETAWKIGRRAADGLSLGIEYYADRGPFRQALPADEQDRTLFLVADLERKGWGLNFGIGKGLTVATDTWTVKAIIGAEF